MIGFDASNAASLQCDGVDAAGSAGASSENSWDEGCWVYQGGAGCERAQPTPASVNATATNVLCSMCSSFFFSGILSDESKSISSSFRLPSVEQLWVNISTRTALSDLNDYV